eukprot:Phypoly_transcript_15760.p1 GENE.Phypoly_transcript_15760~~Phypoly_transcript_15760.p1  ORF type:complete len:284 (+),score=52.80 Phypoly_transcript_15760:109-852(+)
MEIAKQSNQEETEALENDKVEIEKLVEKETHLRAKNEAKLKKGMEVDVQLQSKRELVSFARQRLEALNTTNDTLGVEVASIKNTLAEERTKTRSALLLKATEGKSVFQIELEKLGENIQNLGISIGILKGNITPLENKGKLAEETKHSLEHQKVQFEDMHARNAEMELRRVELQEAAQEIATLTESLRSQLTERTVTWKQLSKELETAKEDYTYLLDLNSSLRLHYDNVRRQTPLPRKRTPNFVYNI